MTPTEPETNAADGDPLGSNPLESTSFLSSPEKFTDTKKNRLTNGCFLTFVIGTLGAAGLVWLALDSAQQIPPFYAEALATPIEDATKQGDQLEIQLTRVQNAARKQIPWNVEFSQEQVNGWLVADLPNKFPSVLPEKMKDPRVHFEPRKAKLAFKYSANGVDGIVIAECDIFCTEKKNQLAIQIISVKSGFVSLPVGPWVERLSKSAERAGIPILWSRRNGNSVALVTVPDELLRFGNQQIVVIDAVEIRAGCIMIAGSTSQLPSPNRHDLSSGQDAIPTDAN